MKTLIKASTMLMSLLGASGCTSALKPESDVPGQTRFEQEQAGYPDRLSSRQEADAAERTRRDEMIRERDKAAQETSR